MAKHKILVIHGPNLNLLGLREPATYKSPTLEEVNSQLQRLSQEADISLDCYQSNSEAELIEKTQKSLSDGYSFLIINPAAYTHTSIAWRDTLLAVKIPFIEVHISNIFAREEFRHKSYFSDIAHGVISGFGSKSYELALVYALQYLIEKGR